MNTYSLINKNYAKVINIIGSKQKSFKNILKNRQKLLKLLPDNVVPELLEQSFSIYYSTISGITIPNETIEDINNSIRKFEYYVLEVGSEFDDQGYSLLVTFYFWLTRNIKEA